ncbi:MAG: hypothetical protein JSV05_06105 [Candidatus Bathyarchaeota archaeon]|nr:MAG: hypothetical protein JSV05_06105 [Candidatus Bathyarchaeota archaeon]
MTTKTWMAHPLSVVIIELLQRKGASTDIELYDMVKEVYGDLGFSVLNKELMRLEIKGIIHVSALMKGKRRVELQKKKNVH